jgi:uncharacterized protein involved in type VI secretion and phage assembly
MSTRALRLPALTIQVNGRPLADDERALLGAVRVCQKLSRPAQCEISFFSQPPASVTATLVPGAALRVAVGDTLPPLFAGEVTALEYTYEPGQGRALRVRGYDRLHRLRKRQPVRAHVQMGLAELARELVGSLGLSVEAPAADLTWRRLIQHGQTDLDFLTQMTEASGLHFTLRGETLHLLTLEGIGEPIPLSLGDTLLEARIEVNADPACRAVATDGWDPLRAEEHEGRASQARVGREVSAEAPPDQVGGTGECTFVHQAVEDSRHAEALAQAELDLRVAREVVLRGVAEGDPRLQPGARVEVQGVAPAVAGRYVLTEVTHVLDGQQRFVSELSTYPVSPLPRTRGTSLIMGKVTSVDDPDKLGRVQVALPACNGVETDWMGVVMVGAGAQKGIVMLPDVGDLVLVLCAQEDPAQGVVLGGLYGVSGPPDGGVENRAVKRFSILTPGGQKLLFDDGKKTVRLQNSDASFVELGPEKVVLHAKADLDIEAPGKTITVRGQAINFEQL